MDRARSARTLRVWSFAQRGIHWSLAVCVIGCVLLHEGGAWHERLGYAALALAAWRVWRGWAGPAGERFTRFVLGPAATLAYARRLWQRREERHLNHNPLGAWMVLALLASALLAGTSGWLYETDRFWGDPVIYALHQLGGWALAALVPLHVAGVVMASRRHAENLVAAMVDGRKRGPEPGDVA
ncbi:MAG: cytochrome b/b6 domain-containing protein [Burkholderiaceae bacterium]